MNMEGTKHEKAVLVVLSYIVGFTSGFIAFGPTQSGTHAVEDVTFVNSTYTPSLATEPKNINNVPTDNIIVVDNTGTTSDVFSTTTVKGTSVYYDKDRLYVSVDGFINVLSVAKSSLSSAVSAALNTKGVHVAIPKYLTSTDGAYVYFCEQQQENDSCVSFVYDVAAKIIQYVAHDGKKVVSTVDIAKSAVWNENGLSFGSYRSQNTQQPWIVTVE